MQIGLSLLEAVRNYRIELGIFAGTILSTLFTLTLSALRFPNDDQFILYRYIDNIAYGHGFVYNIGEHVLGSTTPLFTLIAAAIKYVFIHVSTPDVVAGINTVFLAIGAVLFYKLCLKYMSRHYALCAVLVFILNLTRTIQESMESTLFILLLLLFLLYLFEGRFSRSSVVLALVLLTRPDAGIIVALTTLYWYQKVGFEKTVRLLCLLIITTLPWLIFATLYFGNFVPQSLLTKLHAAQIYNLPALQATKIQAAHLSKIYWGKLFDPDNIPLQITFNLLPFLAVVALGIKQKINKDNWILAAIPITYVLLFALSNPLMFPWYLSQVESFWILLSFLGVVALLEKTNRSGVHILLLCLLLLGPTIAWARNATTTNPGSKMQAFAAATYIRSHMQPGDSIGLADIGIVGYHTNAYIADFIGLITSDSVAFYGHAKECRPKDKLHVIPPLLIEYWHPTWVVTGYDYGGWSCSPGYEWFLAHYRVAQKTKNTTIWRRVD